MKISILLFGILREHLQVSVLEWQVSQEYYTVEALLTELKNTYPLIGMLRSVAVAVNGEYAPPDYCLRPQDEIALIPPVSGG
ncbi:MAG: MoaD/ThiS family protein [Cytophagales bacterium]|nr:MoaD/ThiS family protein [Bernardetiaceae bacterium]MDW8205297.1 MoaD/ThiS family protein [Cytophagales bacterium]